MMSSVFNRSELFSLFLFLQDWKLIETKERFNKYGLPATAPPVYQRARIFRPAELHNSSKHEKLFTSIYQKTDSEAATNEDDDGAKDHGPSVEEKQQDLHQGLSQERQNEIIALARESTSQQPPNDELARSILTQLDIRPNDTDRTGSRMNFDETNVPENVPSSMSSQHSYPPMNRTGPIDDHDRPFAAYGHLDRESIARQCNFNLTTTANPSQNRFRAKSYSIAAETDVSKEAAKQFILDEFGENKIQYICTGEEFKQSIGKRLLLIQIIFKNKIDRRKPFLKDLVGDSCNYQVCDDDLAWNEYIKKSGSFEEYNEFKSIRRLNSVGWDSLSTTGSSISGELHVPDTPLQRQLSIENQLPIPSAKRCQTVDVEAEKRAKIDDDITRTALALAEDSVDAAMDYIQEHLPNKFVQNHTWYDK